MVIDTGDLDYTEILISENTDDNDSLIEEENISLLDFQKDNVISEDCFKDVCFCLDKEEPEEILRNFFNEVLKLFVMEQTSKQTIYGLQYRKSLNKEQWFVAYSKYRSIDEIIENGFFTPEEKTQIYIDNENLIWEVYHKCKPSEQNKQIYTNEDVYETCLIGFTEALNNYNKKTIKVPFSTYAYTCMKNRCLDMIKGSKVKGKDTAEILSFDIEYDQQGEHNDASTLKNTVKSNEHNEDTDRLIDNTALQDTIKLLLEGLDEDHIFVALHYYGILGATKYTKMEIAREKYISAPKVNKYIKEVEQHLSNKAYELGIKAGDLF